MSFATPADGASSGGRYCNEQRKVTGDKLVEPGGSKTERKNMTKEDMVCFYCQQ